jgi:hypothetical protein
VFLFTVAAIAVMPTYHTNEQVPTLTFDVWQVDGRRLGVGVRVRVRGAFSEFLLPVQHLMVDPSNV